MKHSVNRAIALTLAVLLALSLVLAPAAKADAIATDSVELALSIDGADINVKLCGSAELFALLASMGQGGDNLALNLYLGECGLILDCIPILPQAYGIDLENFQENLAKSVFAPDSGSAYALPQEVYDALMSDPTNLLALLIPGGLDMELIGTVLESLVMHSLSATQTMMDNVEYTMGPGTLHTDSGDIKVKQITVHISSEAYCTMMTSFIAELKEDTELKENCAALYDMVVASGLVDVSEDMASASGSDVLDAVWENMDAIAEQICNLYTEQNISATASASLDQETEELLAFGETVTMGEQTMSIDVTVLENAVVVQITANEDNIGMQFSLDEDSDSAFVASIKLTANGQLAGTMRFALDKTAGTFEATADLDGQTASVGGSIIQQEDSLTIRLDTVNGQPAPFDAALILRQMDEISVPSYQDILTLGEEEFSRLLQTVSSMVGALTSSAA